MAVPWIGPFMPKQSLVRDWLKAAQRGNVAAFERLLLLHERPVLRMAQRLLMNSEDAKDAAQEVFLRLHRSLSELREEADLTPWLRRVTTNICIDWMRRSKSTGRVTGGTLNASEPAGTAPNPEQALSRAEDLELITAALSYLSDRERATIVLRDLEGCTTREVAQILGTSETTVRSQISTGRAKIRSFVMARLRRRS